jgi:hypothetical protein
MYWLEAPMPADHIVAALSHWILQNPVKKGENAGLQAQTEKAAAGLL